MQGYLSTSMPDFYLKRNDQLPDIIATLEGVETLAESVVSFKYRKKGTDTVMGKACTIVDPAARIVRVEWSVGDTVESGEYYAEFEAVYPAVSKAITFPNDGFLTFLIVDDLA